MEDVIKTEEEEDVTRKGRSRRWNWERKKSEDVIKKGRKGKMS